MNQVIKQLMERKSVRAFTDQPVSEETVATILEAATPAPTAGNQQLYTIIRVTDPDLKARLAESCDHQPFIATAPVVLVFCADCRKWYHAFKDYGCQPRTPGVGDLMLAVSDANIAAQNAVVAAHSLGIGSCYIGDVMENCEEHRALLHLPDYVFPAAMLVFGYPTQQQLERPKPPRSPMQHIVHENGYRDMNAVELKDMLSVKSGSRDFDEWIKAFCERKYNSDFSREMTRSVKVFLEDFDIR
jgi:nitroreductase